MKKFTLKSVALLAALAGSLAAATVSAQERVRISFVRAGATADEVAVLLSDEDGQPIPGAKATLTLSHELKTTGTAVTPSVLCPDANATGGQDRTLRQPFGRHPLPHPGHRPHSRRQSAHPLRLSALQGRHR